MAREALTFERILICRTDSVADVVLTLPLAGYLKQRHPGVQIDFLVSAYAAPLVRQSRFVDQVLAIEEHADHRRMFVDGGYDTVIFAFPHRRLAQAARRARVANRVGTSHKLFHLFSCNRLAHFSRVRSLLHEAQLNFMLLKPLGMGHVPALADISALYGLQAAHLAHAGAPFNVIIHPCPDGPGRAWPLERYTELARLLQAHSGVCLWVTGSALDGERVAREAPALLAMEHVRNLCGSVDLADLMALLGAAHGVVAGSCGLLHVGAALGLPVLGLFPPIKMLDAARLGALGACAANLCATQRCATCTGPQSCTCMRALTAAQVAEQVRSWQAGQFSQA